MHGRRTWFSLAAIRTTGTLLLAVSPVGAQNIVSPSDTEGSAMEAFIPGDSFTPANKPFAANPNATTTVILKMAGDPVAEAPKKPPANLDHAHPDQLPA